MGLNFYKSISVVFSVLLICVFVSSQANKKTEINRIRAYCKTVDNFTKRNQNPHLIFADTSDYNDNAKQKWRKFGSEKALEKYRENTAETYSISYNWQRNGRIVKSTFTNFSPSGDWAEYVYHYFRNDGTLAKAQQEMRTFNGDAIIIQDFYYNQKGKLLRKTARYLDLQSKKPFKPSKEFLKENIDPSSEINHYKSIGKLPFARLLKQSLR